MSTGNPKFDPKAVPPNVGEKIKSVKEIEWERVRAEVEEMGDLHGMGIDEGIKDTVVAFNVHEIPTAQSCEGHLENEAHHGYPVPWITVEALHKPQWRYEREGEIYQQVAQKYNITVEDVLRAHNEEAWIEARKLSSEQEEASEFKAWDEENTKLFIKVEGLLKEFYSDRVASEEVRIIADRTAEGLEVHNGGKFYIPHDRKERLEAELTEQERARIPEVLKTCQKEMQDFTAFLKNKFLTKKEI